MTSTAREGQI